MAIDIEWQVKPPTKKGETNQPQLFPRIVNADVVGDAELADKIASHSGLSRGVVTNVLEDLANMKRLLLVTDEWLRRRIYVGQGMLL